MNRFAIALCSLALIGITSACGGQPAETEDPAAVPTPPPAAEAPPAEPAPPPPPPAPEPEPEATAEELPVEEDFVEEAETGIDAKNYKVELASLDKELKAEAKGKQP